VGGFFFVSQAVEVAYSHKNLRFRSRTPNRKNRQGRIYNAQLMEDKKIKKYVDAVRCLM
jgi:hypothetical protein